jgi:FtsH-binding integral membrane protein
MPEVNYIEVLVAGLALFVLGFLWYSPPVFMKQWAAMNNIDTSPANKEAMKKKMMGAMMVGLITSLVMVYVLEATAVLIGSAGITEYLTTAFWLWLGFIATVVLSGIFYTRKPLALFFIDSGYYLVGLLVAAAILGYWQ